MVKVVSPLQAALGALVAAVLNATVVLGFISTSQSAEIESVIVGVIAVIYPLVNAHAHSTNAKAATTSVQHVQHVEHKSAARKAPAA